MLGKLLKYDLKASYLYLLICYVVYIVLTIGFTLSMKGMTSPNAIHSDVPAMVMSVTAISLMFLWVFSIIAVVILTYVLIIRRFYTNMVSDEGYLTLTLPVSTKAHMLSKLISGLVFQLVTMLVLLAGLFLVGFLLGDIDADDWKYIFRAIENVWNQFSTYYGVMYFVNMVLSAIQGLLLVYFAICVGQMCNKHKVWGAIGTYFGIVFTMEILVTVIAIVAASFRGFSAINWLASNGLTWVNTIWLVVQILVYFFGGAWILEKKANLE